MRRIALVVLAAAVTAVAPASWSPTERRLVHPVGPPTGARSQEPARDAAQLTLEPTLEPIQEPIQEPAQDAAQDRIADETLGASLSHDLERFVRVLERVRAGDEDAVVELRRVAAHLCVAWERCDARAVAEFYVALAAEARQRGLQADRAYGALRAEIARAGRAEPPDPAWETRRATVLAALRALAERAGAEPDFTPAARAHALLALLAVEEARGWRPAAPAEELERETLLARAEADAERADTLFERAGQRTPRLEPLWVLGRLERARGRPDRARAHFERCAELARVVGRAEYEERALEGLVALAKDAGDVARLERHLADWARVTSPRASWPLAREHTLRLLSADHAEAALAFALGHPPTDADLEPEWHALLAACFVRTGDTTAAREALARAGEDTDELGVLARAACDLAAGANAAAAAALEDAAAEDWSYLGRAQRDALLGEALLGLGRPSDARERLAQAVTAARRWRSRQLASGGSVVGEWLGLHAVVLLARAHSDLDDPLEAARVLEAHQSQRLRPTPEPNAGDGPGELTAAELTGWASAYPGGLVTFGIGADSGVVAWVGSAGDAAAAPLELGRSTLERAVRRLREAATADDVVRASELAAELAETLLPPPIRSRLAAAPRGARTLFLLHGPLEALPLALLALDGEPLDERLVPLVLPGLPSIDAPEPPPSWSEAPWTLAGDPRDAAGDPLLPGAREELAELAALHPDALSLDAASFTRAALVTALRGGGALHVATHLVESPTCGDAALAPVGLVLDGGDVLCAEELAGLRPRLPLVVLSACESGGGRFVDAEGLHGLARAFLESGTRDLVVTLWPVSDAGARAFALELHAALATGAAPSLALVRARHALRADGASLADWAAFRLVGRD